MQKSALITKLNKHVHSENLMSFRKKQKKKKHQTTATTTTTFTTLN